MANAGAEAVGLYLPLIARCEVHDQGEQSGQERPKPEEQFANEQEDGILVVASDDGFFERPRGERIPELRTTNKRVAAAKKALDALSGFLEEQPEDFADWYAETYDDDEPNFSLRPFWDRHLPA